MSIKIKKEVNRTELRVMILRNFGTIKNFTEYYSINYDTFHHYLSGADHLNRLNNKIIEIMVNSGYDPYAPTPNKHMTELEKQQILN